MPKYKRSPTIHTTPFLQRNSRMPSRRRVRAVVMLTIITVVIILLYTSSQRRQEATTVGDFYYKTKNALENKKAEKGRYKSNEDKEVARQMSERLKEAAQVAKDNANAKAPNKPDPPRSVVGVGSAAQGEKALGGRKKAGADAQVPIKPETKEDQDVEAELDSILKRSPIIIFSKSYCPHSKRAKDILLEKYLIEPKPFVVELNLHPLGLNLQAKLAEITNRRTVPNVLINGVSIGGGDEVAGLDETGKLIDKIKKLGGARMSKVKKM